LIAWIHEAGGPGGWKILASKMGRTIGSIKQRFRWLRKGGAFSDIQNPNGSWKWREEAARVRTHRSFAPAEDEAIITHRRAAGVSVKWEELAESMERSAESLRLRCRRLRKAGADCGEWRVRRQIEEVRAARGELPLPPGSALGDEEEKEDAREALSDEGDEEEERAQGADGNTQDTVEPGD
jgi:hypothetical protein